MTEVIDQLRIYGKIVTDILYIIVAGIFLIYILQKISKRFIIPYIKQKRLVQIVLGALYSIVFIITVLLALNSLGFDIEEGGELAILIVLLGCVVFFIISPYLPKLPFRTSHLIEVSGVFGTVESISAYHTCIKRFNGTMVFMPNPSILGSTIVNYSVLPALRIGLVISVETNGDLEKALSILIRLMREETRVLDKPNPPFVEVVNVAASGIDIKANCWVNNKDYIGTKTDLLRRIVHEFNAEQDIALSLPQQEILLTHRDAEVKQ